MSKILNYKFLILFLILIIAAFLRLYNLTPQVGGLPPGLYPDEAMNGNNALEALSTAPPNGGFKVFYPENNGREGLFMNIQAVFLKFLMPLTGGNPEPWMLRVVSALFGIFTVLGIYFLAKELFRNNELRIKNYEDEKFKYNSLFIIHNSNLIALLSAFLMATSFWHINFSRIGFRAIMAPFFMVWALYFLLKALNSEKYKLVSIIGGIFLGLGFYSYIAFRVMPLLIIIVWILYWIKNKNYVIRKKIVLVACLMSLAASIIFAPLGIYFLKNPGDFFGRTAELSITHSAAPLKDLGMNIIKTAGMFNFFGDGNWRHNFAGSPELFWPVGILFIIGLFLGIKSIFRTSDVPRGSTSQILMSIREEVEPRKIKNDSLILPFIVLFSWLIIATLPVVISNEGIPHALRSILLIPPVIILAGFGGIWLYEKLLTKIRNYTKLRKVFLFSIFYFLLSTFVFQAYYSYFIQWGQNPNVQGAFSADYVAIGHELNSLPKEMLKYVVVQAGGVDIRGIPMPAQTVMFITDTFLPEKQKEKNIFYVLPSQTNQIPEGSYKVLLK